MKSIKMYAFLVLGFMLAGLGIAISSTGAQGISAWDALGQSFAWMSGMQLGTWSAILNCSCVLGQILVLRKEFKPILLLQIPLSFVLGTVCNLFGSFINVTVTSLPMGILFYLSGMFVTAIGVSLVMTINYIPFALEGFCMVLSQKVFTKMEFSRVRQSADVLSLILIAVLSLLFKVPWSIGLGTVIGACIFGPTLGLLMKLEKPFLNFGENTQPAADSISEPIAD
ncbi:DUF6198 family protein [Ileibacterium valens]